MTVIYYAWNNNNKYNNKEYKNLYAVPPKSTEQNNIRHLIIIILSYDCAIYYLYKLLIGSCENDSVTICLQNLTLVAVVLAFP